MNLLHLHLLNYLSINFLLSYLLPLYYYIVDQLLYSTFLFKIIYKINFIYFYINYKLHMSIIYIFIIIIVIYKVIYIKTVTYTNILIK